MICYLLFTLLFFTSKTIYSLNPEKLCVNCQYFSINKNAQNTNTGNVFGKCIAFPITESNEVSYLITGKKEKRDFFYCSTARGDSEMCGKEGKKYRKRYKLK